MTGLLAEIDRMTARFLPQNKSAEGGPGSGRHAEAVHEYQQGGYGSKYGGYTALQHLARTGSLPEHIKEAGVDQKDVEATMKDLDEAIHSSNAASEETVMRGTRRPELEFGKQASDLKVGDRYESKGYVSTTTSNKIASKFSERLNKSEDPHTIHIAIQPGHARLKLGGGEKEVVLPRNSRFEVTAIKGKHVHVKTL